MSDGQWCSVLGAASSGLCFAIAIAMQAYALSKASQGTGLPEMLLARPLPPPQVRIIVDPPSTWEHSPRVAANTMPTSSNGMLGSRNFMGVTGGIDEEGEEADNIPDDVPLTRALLQAKVGSCGQPSLHFLFNRLLCLSKLMGYCTSENLCP